MADKKKKTKEVTKVLELEGHLITVDSRNWILDGNSFYSSLSGALGALSDTLLKEKLKGRKHAEIVRIEALCELLEKHDNWFKDITKGV